MVEAKVTAKKGKGKSKNGMGHTTFGFIQPGGESCSPDRNADFHTMVKSGPWQILGGAEIDPDMMKVLEEAAETTAQKPGLDKRQLWNYKYIYGDEPAREVNGIMQKKGGVYLGVRTTIAKRIDGTKFVRHAVQH